MKRILLFILILIMLFCMVGCSSIDYGTVKDKSFSPAHRTYQPMIMHMGKGIHVIPGWVSSKASWKILVENDEGSAWWSVTEEYYNAVNVGDYVDRRPTESTRGV